MDYITGWGEACRHFFNTLFSSLPEAEPVVEADFASIVENVKQKWGKSERKHAERLVKSMDVFVRNFNADFDYSTMETFFSLEGVVMKYSFVCFHIGCLFLMINVLCVVLLNCRNVVCK